jgi:hypothetical protein
LTHFSLESTGLDHHGIYAHDGDADEFRHISGFAVTGPIALHEQSLEFTVMRLGDSILRHEQTRDGRQASGVGSDQRRHSGDRVVAPHLKTLGGVPYRPIRAARRASSDRERCRSGRRPVRPLFFAGHPGSAITEQPQPCTSPRSYGAAWAAATPV